MLLDEKSLTRSYVVANSSMNRERGLSGANSYAKDLGFVPLEYLGAEDHDAPNFTGQPGVNSYYKPAIF
jgi:hypothetical protein